MMDHNQIIHNFEKKIPPGSFFYFFPKSRYKQQPFDCLFVYNGIMHCIEVKKPEDTLKPHQKYYLDLAEQNGARSWVLIGGFKNKRNYYQLENTDGLLIIANNLNNIIFYLISIKKESHHGTATTKFHHTRQYPTTESG